jgi:hypothetical protein
MAAKLNPELNVGDEVVLLYMTDEPRMRPGLNGTVSAINNTPWGPQYTVKWENGSQLDLIPDTDKWTLKSDLKKKTKVDEAMDSQNKNIKDNFNFITYVKSKKDVFDFLSKLQDSGLTNMLAARPFLTYTSDDLKKYITGQFKDIDDYEDIINAADNSRDAIVRGVFNWAEEKGMDMDDMNSINRLYNKLTDEAMRLYVGNYSSFIKK